MKKKVFGYQLSRDKNERKALFRALISSLIGNGTIETTLTKAKAIQPQMEKLITRAKKGSLSDRRIALRFLTKSGLVSKLFDVLAPIFKEKQGGYTKIIKTGRRRGDSAMMAKMIFSDDIPLEVKKEVLKNEKNKEGKGKPSFAKATEGKNDKIN